MELSKIALAVSADRAELAENNRAAAEAAGRDALRDRGVTTAAHHSRVVKKWAELSESGTELAARMADTESRAQFVFNNLEVHGKAWLRGVIETAATGRKCENSVLDVLLHVLQGTLNGETMHSSAALRAVPKNNHSRVVSAVRAYFRAYDAAVISRDTMEVNTAAPFVVALSDALVSRGLLIAPTAGDTSGKRRRK